MLISELSNDPAIPIAPDPLVGCLFIHCIWVSVEIPILSTMNCLISSIIFSIRLLNWYRFSDIPDACQETRYIMPPSIDNRKSKHKRLAKVLGIALFSNHLDNGTNNIARRALIAIGIKNWRAKYNPPITKKNKMNTEMLLTSDGAELNISQLLVSFLKYNPKKICFGIFFQRL